MASNLREELNCLNCLKFYADPVMRRCRHKLCQKCIGNVLDTHNGFETYTCPEGRAEVQEHSLLDSNLNSSNHFHGTKEKQEEMRILCTYCDLPVLAAKTCLQCEISLCDKHLKKHSMLIGHELIYPTDFLESKTCPIHKKILEYYCYEDGTCVCVICCLMGEHKGHQMELLNEASEKKKEKVRNVLDKLISRREETKKRIQSLHEYRKKEQEKAVSVTERVTALFKDVREQLEVKEKRALMEITRQEEQVSRRISDLIQQLEIKKDKLTREMSPIEKLCNTPDPLTVLQERKTDYSDFFNAEVQDNEDAKIDNEYITSWDEFHFTVTLFRALNDIVTNVKAKGSFQVSEASDMFLDVNTAANNVSVSGDLKMVSWSKESLPETLERFQCFQVLSTKSFSSGRHYWEVETSHSAEYWRVGVAYASMRKRGGQSWIGNNDKSWCLDMFNKTHSAIHDSKEDPLPIQSFCDRLLVYLDYEAGRLSFYQLCDPIRHLHTFTATFTEPLHAAFYVYDEAWIRIKS
ncbi:LOW QUALITY PROTEIN: tripartite motif-containing protein 14-like [Discoglossus pictus]